MPSDRCLAQTAISLVKRNRLGGKNDFCKAHGVSWNSSTCRRDISRSLQQEAIEHKALIEELSVGDLKLKSKVVRSYCRRREQSRHE